jgi:hypothetical protein
MSGRSMVLMDSPAWYESIATFCCIASVFAYDGRLDEDVFNVWTNMILSLALASA